MTTARTVSLPPQRTQTRRSTSKVRFKLKGVNLIGNGPDVLRKVAMLGNDVETSDGIWTCGKDGQSVPVGVGCPTIKISSITVGGTKI